MKIHKYHIYWETWECHMMKALNFILKIYKNSRIMVEQRTWDIVLDLIVLSFYYSRPKWRLRSPMVEGNMGKFESRISLFWSEGEFFIERICTFEAWKHWSNSWSIADESAFAPYVGFGVLSIYVVFVDPHQGNSVLCLSLPTTKAYVELIGVKKA